jgi:putative transposase
MDGKGCWRDNLFVEHPWRSVKYEEVYLHATRQCPKLAAVSFDISASTMP